MSKENQYNSIFIRTSEIVAVEVTKCDDDITISIRVVLKNQSSFYFYCCSTSGDNLKCNLVTSEMMEEKSKIAKMLLSCKNDIVEIRQYLNSDVKIILL